jgi:hypothetical protein
MGTFKTKMSRGTIITPPPKPNIAPNVPVPNEMRNVKNKNARLYMIESFTTVKLRFKFTGVCYVDSGILSKVDSFQIHEICDYRFNLN